MTAQPISAMSDEELVNGILKGTGWKRKKSKNPDFKWIWARGESHTFSPLIIVHRVDECMKIVQKLTEDQRHEYALHLSEMFCPLGWNDWQCTLAVSEATARQRAEALYATLNRVEASEA